MKNILSIALIFAFILFEGCGSTSLLNSVSGNSSDNDVQSAYKKISSVFEANNFSSTGDSSSFSVMIAEYKTPWSYTIKGDGEEFHEKIFTLGMFVTVNLNANTGGGVGVSLKPIYWQTEELGDLDKKLNKIADDVNAKIKRDALKKTDPASAFPNTSPLRYFKEDDRESGALTSLDTRVYKDMIVVFSKTLNEISDQLGISKDKLIMDIKK